MAHDHEQIVYDIDEVKELFDASVMTGTIVSVDYDNDTADVNIGELGLISDIPIFYHCEGSNTVVGGSAAFYEDDGVYVLNKNGRLNPSTSDLQVVGLVAGLANCCYIKEDFDVDLSDWNFIHGAGDHLNYSIIAEKLRVWKVTNIGSMLHCVHYKDDAPVEFILRFLTSGSASAMNPDDKSQAWVRIFYIESGIAKSIDWYFLQDKVYIYNPPLYWVGTGAKKITLLDYLPVNAEQIRLEIWFSLHIADVGGSASIDAYMDYITLCGK
jgi:hypothetical protein